MEILEREQREGKDKVNDMGEEEGGRWEMRGVIMSGNVRLSITIWTPINNMPSQSTA